MTFPVPVLAAGRRRIVAGGTAAAGTLFANAARFDGTNDYLTASTSMTTTASKLATASFWFRAGADGTLKMLYESRLTGGTGLGVFWAYLDGTNNLTIKGANASGTAILTAVSTNTYTVSDGWVHCVFSVDMANSSNRAVYVNDVAETMTWSVYTNDTFGFASSDFYAISYWTSGSPFRWTGDMAEIWIGPGEYIDLSVEANRRKFITADLTPADLGSDGSTPTGTSPLIYLSNRYSTFETNNGTGGNFTETGALEYARGPERVEAAYFDGSDALTGSGTSGTDNKYLTLSYWFKMPVDKTGGAHYVFRTGTSSDIVDREILTYTFGTNKICAEAYQAGSATFAFNWFTNDNAWKSGEWNHLMVSYDGVNGTLHTYVNGEVTSDANKVVNSGANIDWSTTYSYFDGAAFDMNLSEFYLTNEYIDLSVQANREKFITAEGRPAFLGFDGSLPTGTQPLIYLNNKYDAFEKNKGSGGDFTVTGSLTEGRTVLDANGVYFDGLNDYMLRGGALTGATDGQKGTCSFWIKRTTSNANNRILYHWTGSQQTLAVHLWSSFEPRLVTKQTDGTNLLTAHADTGISANEWHHIMMSWDTSTTSLQIYVDDSSVSYTVESFQTTGNIDYTGTEFAVGSSYTGASKVQGDLAEIWLDITDNLDLSVEANRRKFITADLRPVFLGLDGSVPTGSQPILYLNNEYDNFETNKGSGGDFTVTGALTESSAHPGE